MENDVRRENFENFDKYVEALKSEDVMSLSRRQLQDIAGYHMEQAKENEDWEQAEAAFRYQDLAINEVGATAETATKTLQALLQVLPDEEEKQQIDAVLAEIEEESEIRAQNHRDRMQAQQESTADEVAKEDIDIKNYKRQFNPPTGPDVEDTDFYVYQFGIDKGEDQQQFDFRVMKIDNPAYRHFESEWSEEEIPDEASWVANQYRGEPSIGTENYFESLDNVEDRIKEVMIAAGTDKTLDEISDQETEEGENQQ